MTSNRSSSRVPVAAPFVPVAPFAILATFVPLTLILGCGPDATETPPSHTVRDSAGITIVESGRPAWGSDEAPVVETDPVVSIGTLDGDPARQFNRVSGMAVTSAGGLVVGQMGPPPVLRWFDAGGALLRTAGGEGEGPGEFAQMTAVQAAPGDTILVWDPRLRRISKFSPEGVFASSLRWNAEESGFPGIFRLGPGPRAVYRMATGAGNPVPGRLDRDSMVIVVDPDAGRTGERTVIGPFPHTEYDVFEVDRPSGGGTVALGPAPFGASTSVAVGDSSIYVVEGRSWEFRRYAYDGRLDRIIRRSGSARPITPDVVEARLEAWLDGVNDEDARRRERARRDEMSLPDSLPVTDAAIVDPDGNLWVRHFTPHFSVQGPSTWSVFAPDGVWLGAVDTPPRLWVRGFLDDAVYGVYHDELEVEYVRRHRLAAPAVRRESRDPPLATAPARPSE